MLSLPKHLTRTDRVANLNETSKMLRKLSMTDVRGWAGRIYLLIMQHCFNLRKWLNFE